MPSTFDGRAFVRRIDTDYLGALSDLNDEIQHLLHDQNRGINRSPERHHIASELAQHGGLDFLVC